MKASDVVPRPARPEISVDPGLMTRNAERAGQAVNWMRTHIGSSRGAAESRPYGKDAAIAEHDRRKRLHKLLDRALSEAGYTQDAAEVRTLHDFLDQAMDGEGREETESEIEEEPMEDEEERHHDSGRRRASSDSRSRTSTSYVCDSDFVSRYLPPNLLCVEAENALRDRVVTEQEDNAMRGYWSGLFYFLRSQPEGSRIKDCRQVTLSTLVSKTLAA
jgi:hypothetical protein